MNDLPGETSCQSTREVQPYVAPRLDILLVVDTSPAMAEEQAHLEANCAALARRWSRSRAASPTSTWA